ncbi:MAG: DUF1667 domain-containing protein, partial [Pygmaiobacter sp.]
GRRIMVKKELTCIGCPMGCTIVAQIEQGEILALSGYTCKVGEQYAREELTAPKRMVTALVRLSGSSAPLSVKTSKPIDKREIFHCLSVLRKLSVERPVHSGEVLLANVCGTDVDIVATREAW